VSSRPSAAAYAISQRASSEVLRAPTSVPAIFAASVARALSRRVMTVAEIHAVDEDPLEIRVGRERDVLDPRRPPRGGSLRRQRRPLGAQLASCPNERARARRAARIEHVSLAAHPDFEGSSSTA